MSTIAMLKAALSIAMLKAAAATGPSEEEAKEEWTKAMAADSEKGRGADSAQVAALAGLRGSCAMELSLSANDIACGSDPGCKAYIVDPADYSGAQWCMEEGRNKYDRKCPSLPITGPGVMREVVVIRKGNYRSLRVRVDEVTPQSMKIHMEAFEGLPHEEAPIVNWRLGQPGADCDATCEAKGESCAGDQSWPEWPESAAAVTEVAKQAGLVCQSTAERCDMGESPIFAEGQCIWCKASGTSRASYMPKCQNKWGDRQRLCPCQEPARSKDSTIFRDECATSSPPHGYGLFRACHRCSYR